MSKEKAHLHKGVNSNGYPSHFFHSATALTKKCNEREYDLVNKITAIIPYIAGISEEIRRVSRSFERRLAFNMDRTILSELPRKQSMVLYCVLYFFVDVYTLR